jgi:DNA excision repair protein ERCC-2
MGKYSVFNFFPDEERTEIVDVAPERVKYSLMNFFNDIRRAQTKN